MSTKLNYLDLFAGAGGLSEGFIRAGFNPVAHVEMDLAACYTLRTRMAFHWLNKCGNGESYCKYLKRRISRADLYAQVPKTAIDSVINSYISEENLQSIFDRIDRLLNGQKLDLIIGGPPCQAYSIVGRSRSLNRMTKDKRNYLYVFYARFLERYRPEYFLFENVTGLLSAKNEQGILYLGLMLQEFHNCGYETEVQTLCAKDYGVPQNRKRTILVGKLGKSESFYPEPEKCESTILVEEILSDLPPIQSGQGVAGPCSVAPYKGAWMYDVGIRCDNFPVTWHQARPHSQQDLEIYRIAVELWNGTMARLNYNDLPERLKTHRQRKSFLDRFKVVAKNLPFCHTVVAHIANDGHYYIHPDINQNRSLTPREAARLQTFPDDYYFESRDEVPRRTPVFCQIGNAVPVLLAQRIAEKLGENWL